MNDFQEYTLCLYKNLSYQIGIQVFLSVLIFILKSLSNDKELINTKSEIFH